MFEHRIKSKSIHFKFSAQSILRSCIFFLLCLFKRYIWLLKKGGKVRLRGAAKTLQQSKKMLTHSSFEHTNTDMIFNTQTYKQIFPFFTLKALLVLG